jgi:Cdc6-like AAA superfamily ATPase
LNAQKLTKHGDKKEEYEESTVKTMGKSNAFTRCFDSGADNEEVYDDSTKEIILSSLNGINGTIFMYGQTGAGKTYTMLGDYSTEILKPTATQLKHHMKRSMINAAERKNQLNQSSDLSHSISEAHHHPAKRNSGPGGVRRTTTMAQTAFGIGEKKSAKLELPKLGIDSIAEDEEHSQQQTKHHTMGGTTRNKDNMMFTHNNRLRLPGHQDGPRKRNLTPRGLASLKMDKHIQSQKNVGASSGIGLGSLKI